MSDRNVILLIFIISAMPMAMSRDCIPGKEFWSTFFNTKGTCAFCPRSLKNCKDQGSLADINACKNSCVKPTVLPSTAILPWTAILLSTTVLPLTPLPTSSNTPSPERSTILPNSSTLRQKSNHSDINPYIWLGVVLALCIVCVAVLVVFVRRSAGKRGEAARNVEEGMALNYFQPDDGDDRRLDEANDERFRAPNEEERVEELVQPHVQATPSSKRIIRGIQEEDKDKVLDDLFTAKQDELNTSSLRITKFPNFLFFIAASCAHQLAAGRGHPVATDRTTSHQEISSREITLPSQGTTTTTAHDQPPLTEPKIINISSRDLTVNEIRLLKRGLKFTPTPPQNTTELKADIHEFSRKLRLAEYFNDKEQNIDNSLAKNKSNFVPPRSEDEHLTLFLSDL
ncbi:Hypothetical predicted protein [Paramuricea clavata]|uniref:Uncharacterized protein n=1 Tax=Paramuricea clavata TaxID=317549 RepID=A0A7D9LIU6_PARCT|nr:Hypothetical predicted protein [Paramuricea clavata]